MMNETSPRGTMPMPMRRAPKRLKLKKRVGSPHPIALAAIMARDNKAPKSRTSLDSTACTLTIIPMTTKKTGTKKLFTTSSVSRTVSVRSVFESDRPTT
jgi:hypothetical protein